MSSCECDIEATAGDSYTCQKCKIEFLTRSGELTCSSYTGEPCQCVSIRLAAEQRVQLKSLDLEKAQVHQPEQMTGGARTDVDFILKEIVKPTLSENLPQPQFPKQYLGGFRNKLSGKTYHHAEIQTSGIPKEKPAQLHRETQTVEIATRSQQTTREFGTQMSRSDLHVDESTDKVLTPGVYLTADELDQIKHKRAIDIQSFLRQCFALRRVHRLREENDERRQCDSEQTQAQADRDARESFQREQYRGQPRTKQHFDILYDEMEAWRKEQMEIIKSAPAPPFPSLDELNSMGVIEAHVAIKNAEQEQQKFVDDQKKQMSEVMDRRLKFLQTIHKLKITATKQNLLESTKTALEKMSSPNEWVADGQKVEVETPFTLRSRELVELYGGLKLEDVSEGERIDVLLNVKAVVQEFDCALTRDIVELIIREEDLLRRGRSSASLAGLRQRLASLFLQFVYTPEFNPQSRDFQTVPYAPEKSKMPIQHSFVLPPRVPLQSSILRP